MAGLALVLTSSADATADFLCERLSHDGIGYVRIDTDHSLAGASVHLSSDSTTLTWSNKHLDPNRVTSVVFRRPSPLQPPPIGDPFQRRHVADEWGEAIEGVLSAIPVPRWLNHPSRIAFASNKPTQLRMAQRAGLAVPAWIITSTPAEAKSFATEHEFAVVVKTMSGGYIERENPADDTVIYTSPLDRNSIQHLDRISGCPVLLQRRLHKLADVRLTAVDDVLIGVSLRAEDGSGSQRLDIRRHEMSDVRYERIEVPPEIATNIRVLMRRLGLRFGAFDFAIDINSRWWFFEVNPNGQWAWLDQAGASDIAGAFCTALSTDGASRQDG